MSVVLSFIFTVYCVLSLLDPSTIFIYLFMRIHIKFRWAFLVAFLWYAICFSLSLLTILFYVSFFPLKNDERLNLFTLGHIINIINGVQFYCINSA